MSERDLLERYSALPDEARRLVDEFVGLLGRVTSSVVPATEDSSDVQDDPAESDFFGMWKDREDLADPDYVRKLRRSEWGESA